MKQNGAQHDRGLRLPDASPARRVLAQHYDVWVCVRGNHNSQCVRTTSRGSTMDTMAPTPEWLAKYQHARPHVDQQTNRTAYRKISQAEQCWHKKEISQEQYAACKKLLMHYQGAHGVKVQQDDEVSGLNPDTEYPTTYHNQKLDAACRAVKSASAWMAMICFVDESMSLVQIGAAPGRTSHPVARAFALGLITAGLDNLVDHWGLSTARKNPP